MSYEMEKIAARLKEARMAKGYSQRALAKMAGVPQSHISKIEQGIVDIRVSSLMALAHALDMDLELIPKKHSSAVKSILRAGLSGPDQSHRQAPLQNNQTHDTAPLRTPATSPLMEQLKRVREGIERKDPDHD